MRKDSIKNRADAIYHLRVGIRQAFPEAIRMRKDIGVMFWRYLHILKVRLQLSASMHFVQNSRTTQVNH